MYKGVSLYYKTKRMIHFDKKLFKTIDPIDILTFTTQLMGKIILNPDNYPSGNTTIFINNWNAVEDPENALMTTITINYQLFSNKEEQKMRWKNYRGKDHGCGNCKFEKRD
jgi:hypothetical protein